MKRILVIRIDFLGDMVCTTALLHAIKQRWPDAEIHVLANSYNAPVLERNPDVSAVHPYVYSKETQRNRRPGMLNAIVQRLALLWRLRRLGLDLVVIPNGGMHKNSIQFARQLGVADCRWHTFASEFDDRNKEHVASRVMRHEALSGFSLLPELGPVEASSLRLFIYPEPQLQAACRERLGPGTKPRIGMFVSNKSDYRQWPWMNWKELASKLATQAEILIFHDPQDRVMDNDPTAATMRWISTPTVTDLTAAMSQLDLVISADSSPVHIGAALQIPVVALFENRPEKYLRWYPLGVPHVIVHAGAQVRTIQVDAVHAAAQSLLPR
jgi:ADP-heptose:LPS heptosyltransferase